MALKSYLVIFEQLVELLDCDNSKAAIETPITQPAAMKNKFYFIGPDAIERFRGTRWQVNFPYNKKKAPDFYYVADSLRDALRLRPELDMSYWSCSTESANDFAFSTNDWADEPDEMELHVLD